MSDLRKLMICPWFGPLPEWFPSYLDSVAALGGDGYDWLIFTDLPAFVRRVQTFLEVECPIVPGGSKIHDFRPAFGVLFAPELVGYDFWGHTDFDCVYGRVASFVPDERLAELDVYSDHYRYLCGPWALYRNNRAAVDAFLSNEEWRERLEDPVTSGWVETGFTETVNESGLRVLYELNHGWKDAGAVSVVDGAVYEDGEEKSFFHFRYTKAWPA